MTEPNTEPTGPADAAVITVAHLSDLHVLDLTGVHWTRYINKRLTGAANLLGARNDAHPIEILEAAVADLNDIVAPDHIAITGDITNLALESEFDRAAILLEPLGGYERVSIIPGNHDIYTKGSDTKRRFDGYFGHLMWKGEESESRTYPWVKQVGEELTMVGFRSAHPVAPLFAHGWVPEEQLSALGRDDVGAPERLTMAMVHHNLHQRSKRKTWMHGMRNRDQILDACADSGVGMVLHGHTHVSHRFRHKGMPVVGCGSSTWRSDNPDHVARYNVYRISGGRLIDMQMRRFNPSTKCFEEAGELTA